MTHQSKDGKEDRQPDLLQFVHEQLSALSEAFAAGPLMQLRIGTPQASVTLVKSGEPATDADWHEAMVERRHGGFRSFHGYVPDGEPGRAYETVNSDVVGVFHSAPNLPSPGEGVEADRVLGYIEALKLRTPVKAGVAGRLVGQVAEDGQAVDFGETIFIIDSGPVEETPLEPVPDLEPPRI